MKKVKVISKGKFNGLIELNVLEGRKVIKRKSISITNLKEFGIRDGKRGLKKAESLFNTVEGLVLFDKLPNIVEIS